MVKNLREIKKDALLGEAKQYADKKARFVVTVCSDAGESFELTYYFVVTPGGEMDAIRFTVRKDEEVPSITAIYLTAVLSENEMKELFGVKVKDMAIDFGGHMFLAHDSPELPMLKAKKEPAAVKGE
ncbi:MAG: NADH-quinone oxidoreductase subunit C [Candidatus Eremiobacteraeota bacterium]|nr:NADH-quinone oxidoreductase subunit C [Candidatus Eremiobacteraeota bacterium]